MKGENEILPNVLPGSYTISWKYQKYRAEYTKTPRKNMHLRLLVFNETLLV